MIRGCSRRTTKLLYSTTPLSCAGLNSKFLKIPRKRAVQTDCSYTPKLANYQSYDINGYMFYTKAKDMDSDYQISGVTIRCVTDANATTERFYGRVKEIWELDYARMHDASMFRVKCYYYVPLAVALLYNPAL